MNQFFNSKRLVLWKQFRESLTNSVPEQQQLELVANWFGQIPTVNYSMDCDDCSNWPTPWELLEDGNICETGLAYLMERTLVLCPYNWAPDRLELILIKEPQAEILRLCLLVDNKHLLNYSHSQVIDWNKICSTCLIQAKFIFDKNRHRRAI